MSASSFFVIIAALYRFFAVRLPSFPEEPPLFSVQFPLAEAAALSFEEVLAQFLFSFALLAHSSASFDHRSFVDAVADFLLPASLLMLEKADFQPLLMHPHKALMPLPAQQYEAWPFFFH